jgi:DNA repair protein RadD
MTLPLFNATPLQALPVKKARPYQDRTLTQLRALVAQGKRRILVVAPTGAGKAFVIASIIKAATLPVLSVAHRKEIIDHIVKQMAQQGISNVGVIRGNDDRWNPSASVQVGSVATLARRDRPFLGQPIILIIDEAHRANSSSYVSLLQEYPDAIVLGFTATPVRLDGRPLGGDQLFEELLIMARYEELLRNPDWLVAPDCFSGRERADLSRVHVAGADFDETELGQVMHSDRLEGDIVQHWLNRAHLHPVFKNGIRVPKQFTEGGRRRTVLFAVNIAHSQSLAARFARAGVRVAHLDGNTPEHERDAMFRGLETGELEMICNCQVAVEGVDVPAIKCVIHACPTMSITKHRQSVGRSMRPWTGIVPLYLDHAGNFDRLGCPFEDLAWSLTERPKRFGSRPPMKMCKACFAYVEPQKTLCPFCGAEFTREEKRAPQESPEILHERNTEPEAMKWAFFWRQVVMAKSKGFKPGFAAAIFREHYGNWPPKHWSEKIKNDFNGDQLWQDTLARRLERKAVREARERQEQAAMGEKSPEEIALEETRETWAIGMETRENRLLEKQLEGTAAAIESVEGEWSEEPIEERAENEDLPPEEPPAAESPFADWLESEDIR